MSIEKDETVIENDLDQQVPLISWHPTLSAVLLLFVLTLLFMGRNLLPSPARSLGGHDMRGYYYPYYDHVKEAVLEGRLPFWEPTLFNGFPFMAQPQQNVFYPPLWLSFILPVNVGISMYMLIHIWLAGIGMHLYVRQMGGGWLPSVLAAIAFAFSGLLAGRLWAGHSTVYALVAWTPWLLLAMNWCVRRGTVWSAIIAGLPLGLCLLAGHIPSFMYVGMIWGLFVIYLLVTEKERRWLVIRQAALMLIIGLALTAVQLTPFLEFSFGSERLAEADYEFATEYSLPPAHLLTLILPEYFGEPTRVGYWSVPTFEELTYYGGLLAILGIILALRRPTRLTWFYLVMMIIGLSLALGRYGVLYPLAYEYLPPFRLVRAPGRATILFLFAVTALLGHVLTMWRGMPLSERMKRLNPTFRWTLVLIAFMGVVAIAATGAVFMALHPTDTSGRLWHQIGGYAIALSIFLVGGGLLWAYLAVPEANLRLRRMLAVSLILLTVFDLWLFSLKFVRLEPVTPDSFWLDAKEVIGDTDARVIPWGVSLFEQNGAMQVGLNSVFGYDSLEPADHIALASSVPDPRSSAYDIMAARYVIAPNALNQYDDGERPLHLLEHRGGSWVYERDFYLPVARMVYLAEAIADNESAIARIHQPDFDSQTTAILPEIPPCLTDPPATNPGLVQISNQEPGYWKIQTDSEAQGLLLLAENAYPGWEVAVDGQRTDSLTAYTSIRAVCVPAGAHEVVWRYVPRVYQIGAVITLMALILVGAAMIMLKRNSMSQRYSEKHSLKYESVLLSPVDREI